MSAFASALGGLSGGSGGSSGSGATNQVSQTQLTSTGNNAIIAGNYNPDWRSIGTIINTLATQNAPIYSVIAPNLTTNLAAGTASTGLASTGQLVSEQGIDLTGTKPPTIPTGAVAPSQTSYTPLLIIGGIAAALLLFVKKGAKL